MVRLGMSEELIFVLTRRSTAGSRRYAAAFASAAGRLRLALHRSSIRTINEVIRDFRILVTVAFLFHAVGVFVLPQFSSLFSSDTLQLMKYSGHGARVAVSHPVIFALYLLPYPALVGLYFLQNWARYLFVAFLLIILIGSFFFGASISGPPETFVSLIVTLLDGAILGLVFMSPLREHFR